MSDLLNTNHDLLGLTSIFIVCLFTFILASSSTNLSKILLVALVVRVLAIFYGHYISPLPDSTADARTFERIAWVHALDYHQGEATFSDYFEGPSSKFLTFLLSIPYYFFGRSSLMAQSFSLLAGIGCVYLGYKFANLLWGRSAANKAGWIVCLFPSLILYSALVMREVYISFFLLLALYGIAVWYKTEKITSIFVALTGFLGAVFFHGSMIVGAIIFVIIIGLSSFKKIFVALSQMKYERNYKILIYLSIFVILSGLYVTNNIRVPYLGNFDNSTNVDRILHKTSVSTRGEAAWPSWTIINSKTEAIYKVPIRSIYFLFAPFPWDVKKKIHYIGMFDAFIYLILVFLILKNIKIIWNNPVTRIILIILLSYILTYSFGVGNFGTGIRHRSKFVIILILLAAPSIKRYIFSKNQIK